MDPTNLKTAAAYINNLLLARGLLRNGAPIDFVQLATPSAQHVRKDYEKSQDQNDSNSVVTAQVINLVHDLILRRDRDQDQQESVAETLRTLRHEASAHNTVVSRLKAQNQELQQQSGAQASQIRTAQAAAHAAEASARTLRDELARTKAALAQVRSQCEKDVKRRDIQIQRLKSHLTTQQRGTNKGGVGSSLVAASINITPGSSERGSSARAGSQRSNNVDGQPPSLEDAEYSLKQETTEFLTQLSQGLSDENDALISLIRGTLATLRELQGIPGSDNKPSRRPGSNHNSHAVFPAPESDENGESDLVNKLETSYDALSSELELVLSSLRDLLTNPSFAPIEEVHIREAEIRRLREGWEKMAGRWKEAVEMMEGWRKRMLRGGDTVNLAELKAGLGLGIGLANVNGVVDSEPRTDAGVQEGLDAVEERYEEQETIEQEVNVEDLPEEEPSFVEEDAPLVMKRENHSAEEETFDPALKEGDVNSIPSSQAKSFPTSEQENKPASSTDTHDDVDEQAEQHHSLSPKPTAPSNVTKKPTYKTTTTKLPTKLPRQTSQTYRKSPAAGSTTDAAMTVSQKLRFAEEEARRASISPPTSSKRKAPPTQPPTPGRRATSAQKSAIVSTNGPATADPAADANADAASAAPKPRKRVVSATAAASGPRRRRGRKSTLSPEELEALMGLAAAATDAEAETATVGDAVGAAAV